MIISVIIPVYNKQKYIYNLLTQIRNQSFSDYECLLIDDGSTDDSGKICDGIASCDSRFKVYHIDNSGVSHARNVGLDNAQGEYITFVDSDDEIHLDYLKNLYECITKYNVDLVISGLRRFWNTDSKVTDVVFSDMTGKYRFESLLPSFAYDQKRYGIYGWCVSKIIPKRLLKEVHFDESIQLAEDLDFYLKIYPKIKSVYIDDKPYYFYRQETDNSLISSVTDENIDYFTQLKIQLRIREYLDSENALTGQNYEICNRRIDDYIFYCLYHSKGNELSSILAKLQSLSISNTGEHKFGLNWHDWLLYNFFNKYYFTLRCSKKIYDRMRLLKHNGICFYRKEKLNIK